MGQASHGPLGARQVAHGSGGGVGHSQVDHDLGRSGGSWSRGGGRAQSGRS